MVQNDGINHRTGERPMKDYTKTCAVCGKPTADCKIPGLHGMLRDRSAAAYRQKTAKA